MKLRDFFNKVSKKNKIYYAEEIGLINDISESSEHNSQFKFGSDEKYIHISDEEAQNIHTVNDIVEMVKKLQ